MKGPPAKGACGSFRVLRVRDLNDARFLRRSPTSPGGVVTHRDSQRAGAGARQRVGITKVVTELAGRVAVKA